MLYGPVDVERGEVLAVDKSSHPFLFKPFTNHPCLHRILVDLQQQLCEHSSKSLLVGCDIPDACAISRQTPLSYRLHVWVKAVASHRLSSL